MPCFCKNIPWILFSVFNNGLKYYLHRMKCITVFCGSSGGNKERYREQAEATGRFLAQQGIDLVFGGGKVGLMGVLADAALESGGRVTGVIPGFLKTKEVAHEKLTELIVVNTMHERKALMYEMSDGFMALPGGYGTLEELFEMLTWGQLGLHPKPVGVLNIEGFFDHLLLLLDHMVQEGFVHTVNRNMVLTGHQPENLFEKMLAYKAPQVPKWL
jgi:uncharacterized protein (TIGR00730 family)